MMIELAYIGAGVGLALFSIAAYNFVRHRIHGEDRVVRKIIKWLPAEAVIVESTHDAQVDGSGGVVRLVWKRRN